MPEERLTVTLSSELVRDIDRHKRNRSRLFRDTVPCETARRHRENLRRSLRNAHPETRKLAELGIEEWAARLPDEQASDLVDPNAGRDVRWTPGEGWREVAERFYRLSDQPRSSWYVQVRTIQ